MEIKYAYSIYVDNKKPRIKRVECTIVAGGGNVWLFWVEMDFSVLKFSNFTYLKLETNFAGKETMPLYIKLEASRRQKSRRIWIWTRANSQYKMIVL